MPAIQIILHPTDFSDHSRYAFQTACSLARDYNARLILLYVAAPCVAPLSAEPPPDPLQPAESQDVLKGGFPWPQPADPKIVVEHRVAEGDAQSEILSLATALKCDLIVMGTHGRTGLGRLLTGSVAEDVLRKAACPVLLVRSSLPETLPVQAQPLAKPAEIVDIRPLGKALTTAKTETLAKVDECEISRAIVPAGQNVSVKTGKGMLVVECVEGRVAFTASGKTQSLGAGTFLYLPAGEFCSAKGIDESSILLMIQL